MKGIDPEGLTHLEQTEHRAERLVAARGDDPMVAWLTGAEADEQRRTYAEQLCGALREGEAVELRLFRPPRPGGGKSKARRIPIRLWSSDPAMLARALRAYGIVGRQVYVYPQPRDPGGGRREHIRRPVWLLLDLDTVEGGHTDAPYSTHREALAAVASGPVSPAIVVSTGTGIHAYVRMPDEPAWTDAERWETYQRWAAALARGYQADAGPLEPTGGLRAPGTARIKPGSPPLPVRLLWTEPDAAPTPGDLDALVEPADREAAEREAARRPARPDREDRPDRATVGHGSRSLSDPKPENFERVPQHVIDACTEHGGGIARVVYADDGAPIALYLRRCPVCSDESGSHCYVTPYRGTLRSWHERSCVGGAGVPLSEWASPRAHLLLSSRRKGTLPQEWWDARIPALREVYRPHVEQRIVGPQMLQMDDGSVQEINISTQICGMTVLGVKNGRLRATRQRCGDLFCGFCGPHELALRELASLFQAPIDAEGNIVGAPLIDREVVYLGKVMDSDQSAFTAATRRLCKRGEDAIWLSARTRDSVGHRRVVCTALEPLRKHSVSEPTAVNPKDVVRSLLVNLRPRVRKGERLLGACASLSWTPREAVGTAAEREAERALVPALDPDEGVVVGLDEYRQQMEDDPKRFRFLGITASPIEDIVGVLQSIGAEEMRTAQASWCPDRLGHVSCRWTAELELELERRLEIWRPGERAAAG